MHDNVVGQKKDGETEVSKHVELWRDGIELVTSRENPMLTKKIFKQNFMKQFSYSASHACYME